MPIFEVDLTPIIKIIRPRIDTHIIEIFIWAFHFFFELNSLSQSYNDLL